MKKIVNLLAVMSLGAMMLNAETLQLKEQELKDWHIKSKKVEVINKLPLGSFMAEVVTPPQYIHTITLPFEAQVKSLNVAKYDTIHKGQLLAMVTGYDWITIQQKFIQDSIELKHHRHLAERKNRLCNDGIIPKKECTAANAEYKADKIKFASAKALLRGYGASEKIINDLFNNLKISQNIPLRSKYSGKLLELNVGVGKSTQASQSLFVIQKKGALWLESDIDVKKARKLKDGATITIHFGDEEFQSRVLLHAPSINVQNQTQRVRFSLEQGLNFLTGLREMAEIILPQKVLKVPKESVISLGGTEVVFVQSAKGFDSESVKILGEAKNYYYVQDKPSLHQPIVTTSVAILKSMMESGDE